MSLEELGALHTVQLLVKPLGAEGVPQRAFPGEHCSFWLGTLMTHI